MSRTNPIAVGLVVFFIAFNFTVDRYWVSHAHDLPALAHTHLFARLFETYAQADRGYYDRVTEAELALETVNSTITQGFTILLLLALLRRWPVRVPLQMAIGSYVAYSVLFNWWCAAIAGFPGMDDKSPGHFVILFGANLPWLLGHVYLAYDGIRISLAALRRPAMPEEQIGASQPSDFAEAHNLRQQARAAGLSPNYWYAMARDKDIRPGAILATRFQGEPIAIYRGADGRLRAVEDRCRHRGIPLSLGEVEDCALVCPYHGWTYGEDGRLTRIPHELFGRPLPRLRLRTYPLRTRYGLVWVFPGDQALAETTPMPEIPELEGPAPWACVPLEFEWRSHHSIIIDNLSDLAHGFLHRRYRSFANPVLLAHGLRRETVYCSYRVSLRRGPVMKHLLDRTDDMEAMELCFEYPYQWGNTGGRIKHWVFLLPLDHDMTKVFFLFYFSGVKVPFTPFHFPQRLMGWVIRYFNPIFIRPVVSQDGEAVAWEQGAYKAHPGRPLVELNPAVPLFQELIVRKWREYLASQPSPGDSAPAERSTAA